jgi:hypothetical protein
MLSTDHRHGVANACLIGRVYGRSLFVVGIVSERVASSRRLRRAPAVRPHLRLVSARPDDGSTRQNEEGRQEVKLSALELDLIYRSLEAARTLRIVPPQDELLEDTIQLVDQALRNA